MMPSQLERLKQDYQELEYYIARLQKEGDTKRIAGIQSKQKFLLDTIQSLEMTPVLTE